MKIVALALTLLLAGDLLAQDYAFKVLINKGQNEVRTGSGWTPVKVGARLLSGDELRVSPSGYVGLVHVTGKPLEVKEAGQHKVVDLSAKVREGASVLNKYTDFILSTNADKQSNLTATGAVHRGGDEIKVFLPKPQKAVIYNDEISISWAREPKTDVYVVRFNSMFGDELEKMEVRDTTLTIDLSGPRFVNEDNILVEVSSKSNPRKTSEPWMLKKLSSADKKRISTALSEISDQTSERTALNQLLLAGFYESHALLIDAASAYLEAIRLAPSVPQFRADYAAFIERNGLKDQ